MVNITTATIRFWEECFGFPVYRNKNNQRRFTVDQVRNFLAVNYLLCVEMYTIKGAVVKYEKWLKNQYEIPEEYLTIPEGFELSLIDDGLEY